MEVSNLSNTVQRPIQPMQEMKQGQNNHQGQKPVMEKIKQDPGYTPTLQEEAAIKAIETANKKINGGPREFEFSIHEETKQIMVKVIDTSTKEVIRELPSEKILDMVASMWEAAGLFVDEKR